MTDESFDLEAFLRDSGDAGPTEPSAAERQAKLDGQKTVHINAWDMYDEETQAFIFLLAHMVAKLGGAAVLTAEDRRVEYRLAIDQSELRDNGVLRLFATADDETEE